MVCNRKLTFPKLQKLLYEALQKCHQEIILVSVMATMNPFSATRRYKRHQNKVRVKGLGRNSSYLVGFFYFYFFMVL